MTIAWDQKLKLDSGHMRYVRSTPVDLTAAADSFEVMDHGITGAVYVFISYRVGTAIVGGALVRLNSYIGAIGATDILLSKQWQPMYHNFAATINSVNLDLGLNEDAVASCALSSSGATGPRILPGATPIGLRSQNSGAPTAGTLELVQVDIVRAG